MDFSTNLISFENEQEELERRVDAEVEDVDVQEERKCDGIIHAYLLSKSTARNTTVFGTSKSLNFEE